MATPGRTRKEPAIEGEVVGEPTTEEVEASLRDIGDLKIMMRRPSDAQIALIGRLAVAAQREPEKYFTRLVDAFFRVVEGLLVNPDEDIPRIENAIIDDKLTIEAITKGLGTKDKDAAPAARVRTRRAR